MKLFRVLVSLSGLICFCSFPQGPSAYAAQAKPAAIEVQPEPPTAPVGKTTGEPVKVESEEGLAGPGAPSKSVQIDNPPNVGKTYIPVGAAKKKKAIIAFPEIRNVKGASSSQIKTLTETIVNDLNFMDLFKMMDSAAFVEDEKQAGITTGTFKLSDWTSIGAEFLIKSSISTESNKSLAFEVHVFDTFGSKQILAKRYLSTASELKTIGHTFANDFVQALTGLPGIFLTKIAMTCDRTGKKEIYVMNFDGSDVKQVTHHRSLSFAPAWSPDGTKIVYSLFNRHQSNVRNIDLYEYNFTTSTVRLLSNRKGINSGAAFSPDGRKLALTMSFLGNPEIFLLDLATSSVVRLTKSFGVSVDPAWSPDGKNIAFVSNRTGMPMVFRMASDGSNIQRMTFAGKYNATPTWSPQNNKIGFAGWIDKSFDIFIMNPDGTNIERLTKDQANNEDPFFSPDGNFMVFSSNRTGQKNIYVMNTDGTFVKRLTYGLGSCVSPKWSPPPTPKASDIQS